MSVQASRLGEGNSTLYGEHPVSIANELSTLLNQLNTTGQEIVSVHALPDYHNFTGDGGIKDVIVLHKGGYTVPTWHVTAISRENTLHGWYTEDIMNLLRSSMATVERQLYVVRFVVFITDHHDFTASSGGIGGKDGVKNILLCYHPSV